MPIVIEDNLEPARGYFDRVEYIDGSLNVYGWMMLPGKRLEKLILFIDKSFIKESFVLERDDVGKAFNSIPDSKYSGFNFLEKIDIHPQKLVEVCMVGTQNGKQITLMKTCYSKIAADKLIERDKHLMQKVAHTQSVSYFRASSFKTLYDFWEPACAHADQASFKTVLDWGCGCGRLIELLRHLKATMELYGCDIDAEAIDWCKKHLANIKFNTIPLLPPTVYPDNFFDLVIGNSVFTHLTKENQLLWLQELNRIIKKDGLLLATVHGEFATQFQFPTAVTQIILKEGIHDGTVDNTLGDIAPADYYRGTFQTQEYTKRVFGRYFEVVDYIKQGSLNFQDIVVMRKKFDIYSEVEETGKIGKAGKFIKKIFLKCFDKTLFLQGL